MSQTLNALLRRRGFGLLAVVVFVLGMSAVAIGGVPHQKDSNEKYKYFGNTADAVDPMNSDNDVVRVDTATDPNVPGGMFRKLKETVSEVTDQVEFKYLFTDGRTDCAAGSPRVDLFVDTDGDKKFDTVLRGYVLSGGNSGCAHDTWQYADLANLGDPTPRWTVNNANTNQPWSAIVAQFGSDDVLFAQLVDDSQAFSAADRGTAYYDLVSIGNRTFVSHEDGN